ncbi:hypothetical protein HDZ31DRAFT_36504 [Schizophyllum fasciatum]
MSTQNVLVLGGSKNIGYFTAVRLLDAGATVTFFLRNTAVFDDDAVVQKAVKAGKARLVKGDGLKQDDVARAWAEASRDRPVDTLLFTVGGTPKFSLTKGFLIEPHNLVTQCLLNTLCTLPRGAPPPRIVAVSSSGLTKRGHAALPAVLKPVYSLALAVPHRDKLGVERVLAHCAGRAWDAAEGEPAVDIMGEGWRAREGLPAEGALAGRVLVVRPALLTDGACEAEKGKGKAPYRVTESELGGYTVSRRDVGHFIAKALLQEWDQYAGKIVNVGY